VYIIIYSTVVLKWS